MNYEGFCQFCGREVGDGHERSCPYWQPKPPAGAPCDTKPASSARSTEEIIDES